MDDRQLAAGIRRKEEEALDELISQYGRLIKSIVTYHLGDFYRDECINDVLFCIWNHIDQYNPWKNSLKNWIGAICKYKCIDYKRKYYKENFVELDESIPVADQTEKIILEQERLTMKKNLKQSNKAYHSRKRMMWAAGLAACLAVTSQTAFAKDLAEKIFSLGHSSIMVETESDSAEQSAFSVPDELKGQIFDADGKELTELSSDDPGYYDKDGNPVQINSVEGNDGKITYSISKYSADDPLGDVDGAVAFDSVDDMDLSFDLKVPETLPDGFSLTKVYGFSEDDGNVSPDYAVLAYSNGNEGFTIHERRDSEDTQFVTTLPDPQEMDFHGSTAVYNDSEFYANWDGTTISILGNDVLTGDALLEVAESLK